MLNQDENDVSKIQADRNSIAVGGITAGRDISGNIHIGNVGYTVDEVSVLITQITTTFQPKPFDGRCPYKGLDVFEEEDAELFFGREKLVEDLVSRVKDSRTVFVTGPSGSGKSSLVRAGLIHALKQGAIKNSERWLFATMKPGRDPLSELGRVASSQAGSTNAEDEIRAKAIGDASIFARWCEIALKEGRDKHIVLFIDQFEEVFTQIGNEAERITFLNLLTHAATVENGRIILLFSMRSDFVSNCATYPQLNSLLNQQFVQIGAMQPEELVSAIAQPALRVGLRIDPDLIAQIINEMKGEPGALPLMQFALKDLFDYQQEKSGVIALTLNDYLQRGGIHKALERHADDSFSKLSKNEQELARSIFSGLIEIGRGTQDTRRTALFDELVPANTKAEEVSATVQKLADARLIITDEQAGKDIVTISHEKLIDAWPWLKKLVNENRDVIALQNEIANDTKEWEDHKRDASYLYTGARLANAQEQLQAKKLVLGGSAYEFVQAGRTRQQRSQITLIAGISAIIVLLLLAVIVFSNQSKINANTASTAQAASTDAVAQKATAQAASTLAVAQQITAQANADEAQRQSRISLARELAAKSVNQVMHDGDVGLLLAVEAVKISDALGPNTVPEAHTALYETLSTANFDQVLRGHASRLTVTKFSPDSSLILTADAEGQARLWHTDGTKAATLTGMSSEIFEASFSPDGQLIVTGGLDNTVRLWRKDGSLQATLGEFDSSVYSVEFSPKGELIAAASSDGTARVWRIDGTLVVELKGHMDAVWSARFSPDESMLVTASGDKTARVWRIDGTLVAELKGHTDIVWSARFSPDGKQILTAGWDNTARLWNIDGTPIAVLEGHVANVNIAEFSPDGSLILTAGADTTARLWKANGTLLAILPGHTSFVNSASFSLDGSLIVTASSDDTARVWRSDGAFVTTLRGHSGDVQHVAFSPDGKWIVTGSDDNTARLWRVDQLFSHSLEGHTDWVNVVAYSPDGSLILTASDDGTARLWSPDGRLMKIMEGHTSVIRWAAFSQDGSRILTASEDGTARLWKSDGTFIHDFEGSTEYVWSACLSPDGTHIVTPNDNGPARLWLDDGTQLAELDTPVGVNWLDFDCFSPDGRLLAAPDASGLNAHVWQADGKLVATLIGHTGQVNSVHFSPDGSQLITASDDGTARMWRIDGTLIRSFSANTTTMGSAVFSANGHQIITFNDDDMTRVWQVEGTLTATLAGSSGPWAISPDQASILTFDPDSTIRLWRLDGSLVSVLTPTFPSSLSSLEFSRNGQMLLLGGVDGTARLWDTRNGQLIASLTGHSDQVWSPSFSPDGSHVLTTSRDGLTLLWPIFGDINAMVIEAQRRVGRGLSDSECQTWMGRLCELLP